LPTYTKSNKNWWNGEALRAWRGTLPFSSNTSLACSAASLGSLPGCSEWEARDFNALKAKPDHCVLDSATNHPNATRRCSSYTIALAPLNHVSLQHVLDYQERACIHRPGCCIPQMPKIQTLLKCFSFPSPRSLSNCWLLSNTLKTNVKSMYRRFRDATLVS
jgi:hypothetical protein